MSKQDHSSASLPKYINVKVECLGRQVHVRRANLGDKIKLMAIFARWLGLLSKKAGGMGMGPKVATTPLEEQKITASQMDFMSEGLPLILDEIHKNYYEVLTCSTDLKDEEIESLTDISELVLIFQTIWKVNAFDKELASLGKFAPGAGLVPETSTGSKPPWSM